jgi:hypothetical protein
MAIVLTIVLAMEARKDRARGDVLSALKRLSSVFQVYLGGQEVRERRAIVDLLATISAVEAHHSHPTRPIRIEIRDRSGSILLNVGQDSERPKEFWVFVPSSRPASKLDLGLEIGRFRASTFPPEP